MEEIFFELVRVSIGNLGALSRVPTEEEWQALFEYAKYQALVGFLFDGVGRLPKEQMPPSNLFLKWMALANIIHKKNEALNDHCAELCEMLRRDGFKPVILKGQGNSRFYPNPYARQAGDIDVWIDADKDRAVEYVNAIDPREHMVCSEHIDCYIFSDVEVEVHYALGQANIAPVRKRLTKWFTQMRTKDYPSAVLPNGKEFVPPTMLLNLVHQLAHIDHHLLQGGIGLKQILDYYYLLKEAGRQGYDFAEFRKIVPYLRLKKLAMALMYVLHKAFGMEESLMPFPMSEYHGEFLYREIILSGNFGQKDSRKTETAKYSRFPRFFKNLRLNTRFIPHFPKFFLHYYYGSVRRKAGKLLPKKIKKCIKEFIR